MTKEESNLINQHPQRWEDFLAGVQWNYPHEVPPMIMVRRDFVKHIKQTEKATINSVGHIQYIDKRIKPDPIHGYLDFKLKR